LTWNIFFHSLILWKRWRARFFSLVWKVSGEFENSLMYLFNLNCIHFHPVRFGLLKLSWHAQFFWLKSFSFILKIFTHILFHWIMQFIFLCLFVLNNFKPFLFDCSVLQLKLQGKISHLVRNLQPIVNRLLSLPLGVFVRTKRMLF